MRAAILALALAVAVGVTTAHATTSGWSRYVNRRSGTVVIIKDRCLNAEDSAGHLRLRAYDPSRIVYGCARTGY
jgi:hypothetical protein